MNALILSLRLDPESREETLGGNKGGDPVPPGSLGGQVQGKPTMIVVQVVKCATCTSVHGSPGPGFRLCRHNDYLSVVTGTILIRKQPKYEGIFGSEKTRTLDGYFGYFDGYFYPNGAGR